MLVNMHLNFTKFSICTFVYIYTFLWVSLVAQRVKNLPAMQETQVRSLGQEDTLEKGMAIHSKCSEESGGLQSMGSQRVGHDLATITHTHTHTHTHTILYNSIG